MIQKPKGRPKGKTSSARAARRQTLAAAVIQGKPLSEVARQQGVTRSWASREANAAPTQILIAKLLDKHGEEMEELVELGLQAIRDSITPMYTLRVRGKRPRQVPNEPRVRLLAMKRVIELAAAGRKHEEGAGDLTFTWQQFLTVYQAKKGDA